MAGNRKSYWEQLRDPKWQKKRLEVMERADFECEDCGSKTKTLNVHHTYYLRGHAPWDYPDEHLKCLCEPCHEKWGDQKRQIELLMAMASVDGLDTLFGCAVGMAIKMGMENTGVRAVDDPSFVWPFPSCMTEEMLNVLEIPESARSHARSKGPITTRIVYSMYFDVIAPGFYEQQDYQI